MVHKRKEKFSEYKELPYTVVGHTSRLPSFNISLTAKGLKKLLENSHDEDVISITIHDKKRTEFEISRYEE